MNHIDQLNHIPTDVQDFLKRLPIHDRLPQTPDITGQRIGHLTALAFAGYRKDGRHRRAMWHCFCELTGLVGEVYASSLKRGHTQSLHARLDSQNNPRSSVKGVTYYKDRDTWIAKVYYRGGGKSTGFALRNSGGYSTMKSMAEAEHLMKSFLERYDGWHIADAVHMEEANYLQKDYYTIAVEDGGKRLLKRPALPYPDDSPLIKDGKVLTLHEYRKLKKEEATQH